jgi:hypothetical protein
LQETITKGGKNHEALTESEFLDLFAVLTDLPEYKNALRFANSEGNENLDAAGLQKFLTEEQGFKEIDTKKAEAIIEFCEPTAGGGGVGVENYQNGSKKEQKVMTITG